MHVRFNVDDADGNALFANDTFIHYFAESELIKKKDEPKPSVAFDRKTCTAFKLDRLKMGEQARRIAAFEESREEG